MRKNTKKAVCIIFAVILLACSFPISAFAVDPVSASVIANSFAQAITAYGAANGVSLGFDVANTDGIGESVHELWTAFRNGTQTADDYDTLAEALFPDLYYKAERALAGAQTASYVGMRISSEYAEEFDNFYNWLLSGPAEMVQVDNQFYQWSSAQTGPSAVPLSVYSSINYSFNGNLVGILTYSSPAFVSNSSQERQFRSSSSSVDCYCYIALSGTAYYFVSFLPDTSAPTQTCFRNLPNGSFGSWMNVSTYADSVLGHSFSALGIGNVNNVPNIGNIPFYTVPDGSGLTHPYQPSNVLGVSVSDNPVVDTVGLGVKAYGDATTADFPDTADPNYDALHRAKDVPLDIPWDDTLYGDGSLTDAEREAIAGTIDGVLVQDGVLDLVDTGTADPEPPGPDDAPSDEPGDYGVVGLENLFPFCIPFDIYNFLNALAATPTAPHFTATLQLPAALGGAQTIDLDFDNPTFNQLAQLLRLLELLAFIVGLALLTRSMFIRG